MQLDLHLSVIMWLIINCFNIGLLVFAYAEWTLDFDQAILYAVITVAVALFTWDTASGYGPADYAQVLADVAHDSEADALVADVRAYLPTAEAWMQLRQYQTRQRLTIDDVFVPDAWETAIAQAAPGQIPDGAAAYTITGTRHRDGIWDTTPAEASRPVAFTVFMTCTPPNSGRSGAGLCELLRLSELDHPLR